VTQLAPEELAMLDILIDGKRAREQVPIPDRAVVSRSEKYAFAIGIDEAGNPYPIPERHDDETNA
jgi:hypothetical protein